MVTRRELSGADVVAYLKRNRWVVVGFTVLINLWIYYSLRGSWFKHKDFIAHKQTNTDSVKDYPEVSPADQLRPHGLQNLSSTVQISTLHLHAINSDHQESLVEDIDVALATFQPWDASRHDSFPSNQYALPVRMKRMRTNAENLIFGVATLRERLYDSLDTFAHWAAFTGTTIVALLPSEEPMPKDGRKSHSDSDIERKARSLGINLETHESTKGYIERYVRLTEVMHNIAKHKPAAKWGVLIDDDTFFPSMSRLSAMLGGYDSSKPHYEGALSENLDSVRIWGPMAFGGAGIFLSMPLLAQLQPYVNRCVVEGAPNGDGKIHRCINRYTTVKMSPQQGLHQIDILGDPSGFYEAVRSIPLSVHHYKSLAHLDMQLMASLSSILGEDQMFQKYHFANDWWMTNGFSIVKYSTEKAFQPEDDDQKEWFPPLTHREGAMEKTFYITEGNPQKFLHSMMPLAPKDDGKIQFMLESAVRENADTISLYYVNRIDGIGNSVIRIIWSVDSYQRQVTSTIG